MANQNKSIGDHTSILNRGSGGLQAEASQKITREKKAYNPSQGTSASEKEVI